MKEIPILYSTPMAIAKREGRKTQTRRIVKPQPDNECYFVVEHEIRNGKFGIWYNYNGPNDSDKFIPCPWQEGDVLWGRETFMQEAPGCFVFKAEWPDYPMGSSHWKPSIFMPKKIAQIWERVVDVRVERLQEISEEDAIPVGVVKDCDYGTTGYRNYLKPDETVSDIDAVWSYQTLWESINGPGSWEANPWVWVIETEILSTTGRPKDL